MVNLINSNLEFYEVINAFPILRKSLSKFQINISKLREGESINEYFGLRERLEDFEIKILIKKLNYELNNYFEKEKPIYFNNISGHDYNFEEEEDWEEEEEE